MTPYVSRYRRIWVIAYSLVRPWSCVEGRVRKSTACSSFGSGSVNNPSQGIPGPFSFKRLQIWITDALVERTAQLINRSSPTSRNHSPHPSTFSSSPVCTLRRPTSLALPSGFMFQMGATITPRMKSTSPLWCSAISPMATMRSRTTFGSSTPSVICRTICRREGCFAANLVRLVPLADASLTN